MGDFIREIGGIIGMYRQTKIFLALIFVVGSNSVFAGESMEKGQWIKSMKDSLPSYACQEDQYFRKCFNISEQVCRNSLVESFSSCLKKVENEIPNTIEMPEKSEYWGQRIGSCAGSLFEEKLKSKKVDSGRCNDPENWK